LSKEELLNILAKSSIYLKTCFPKKLLGAWIPQLRKIGQPQLSCNNNFTRTLQKILPEHIKTREAAFKEWLQVVKDTPRWKQIVQDYFESCRTTEPEGASNNNNPGDTSTDEDFYNYSDKD
jgi:hypothetical protein